MGQNELDTNIEIVDKEGREILEAQKASITQEVEVFLKQIALVDSEVKNYKTQVDLDHKIFDLQLANFSKDPQNGMWEFEKLPEFWELQKEKQGYKIRQDRQIANSKLKEFEKQKEKLAEQLDSCRNKLKDIEARLEK